MSNVRIFLLLLHLMKKRWIVNKNINEEEVSELSKTLKISTFLSRLLLIRNIQNQEQAQSFFKPDLNQLNDPFLMKDMEKAVERIQKAIKKKERILIFGDYDVDGTSAVALMYTFLKRFNLEMEYYVPDRYNEGYGISNQAVEYAHTNKFTLMIVLDCGIKCFEQINLANSYNIDTIICDHHLSDDTIPNAYAVLDPKQKDCPYPFKELSGCGVGFKLIQAIAIKENIPEKEVYSFLDLVVISIASDIVPIIGENRILAHWGLRLINLRPRHGIESILSYSNINRTNISNPKVTVFNQEIKINDLVFIVGPRINAAGRMDTGRASVHLLISDKAEKAMELGERINGQNMERKELDSKITLEAKQLIDGNKKFQDRKSLMVYSEQWSKGVIGIVASRLVEHYYKPTIVLSLSNNIITGSARSVPGFDLYAALCRCSHLLEHFGGHMYAAGLSLKPENLMAFEEAFEEAVVSSIQETSTYPSIDIDEELPLHEINSNFYGILEKFEPFGPENLSPIFITKNVLANTVRVVGRNHLRMTLYQRDSRSFPIDAIGFDMGQYCERIEKGVPFHICYHIERNDWQGRSNLQLMIKDIKFNFYDFDII